MKILDALSIVFRKPKYVVVGLVSMLVLAVIYAFAGQVVSFVPGGVFYDFDAVKVVPLSIASLLFGIVVALQVYAFKHSSLTLNQGASGFYSSFIGLTTTSCCASLLPALLSLVGFSGSNLILLNAFFRRYVVLFTLITGGLLLLSMHFISKSICAKTCGIRK
ncbi:hypothetical protein HY642_03530 [Candidatus Woesearchaeota archaeon]|nr:hypothetical protein [Candidatus Woesearchaeota archaeon]